VDLKDGILFIVGVVAGYYIVAHFKKTGKAT
jgi:hypothetical protein